jgi:hypothetical protein
LPEGKLDELACFFVAWFEDVVSQAGIWNAFVSQHHELYGKYLPFYDTSEYFPEEINPQDAAFLFWYFILMAFENNLVLSPMASGIVGFGDAVYAIFDKEWDNAPVNEKLKGFLSVSANETDYYKVRYKIDWLALSSHLFYFKGIECTDAKIEVLEEADGSGDTEQLEQALELVKDIHDSYVVDSTSNLLALRGSVWLANVLGGEHPLYQHLLALGKRKPGKYLYLKHDDTDLYVKHLGSGRELKVTRKSLEPLGFMKANRSVLLMSLANWMGEWWFSGVLSSFELTDEILLDEVSNPANANLFSDENLKKEAILEQYESFLEYNNGSPIAFLEDMSAFKNFTNQFLRFHNKKMSKKRDFAYDE